MTLTTTLKKVGTTSVLSLTGRVTLGKASESLGEAMSQVFREPGQNIVLNLAGVPFIDSAGLGMLVVHLQKAKAAGGLMKLAEPQARVRDALQLTQLTKLFPLYETEREAVNSFHSAEPGFTASVAQVQ